MSPADLIALLKAGPLVAVIGYLIYRESNDRKDRQSETESRLKLATALEALKNFIMGRHDV